MRWMPAALLDTLEEEVIPLYYAAQRQRLLPRVGAALQARGHDRDPALQHAPRGAATTAHGLYEPAVRHHDA